MEQFKRWLDAIRTAGITMPVDVGVMPVVGQRRRDQYVPFQRTAARSPAELAEVISHHWFDTDPDGNKTIRSDAMRSVRKGSNTQWTSCTSTWPWALNGIHLYAMNTWKNSKEILDRAGIRTII